MEFWGAEVKSGQSLVVDPGKKLLHLLQACLDDLKKSDPISLFAKVDDLKLVLGFLSAEKSPQLVFDILFDEKFELSHNWTNGSVHFTGYKYSEEEGVPPIRSPTLVDKGKAKVNGTEVAKKPVKSEQKEASSDDDDESDDEEFVGHQALAEGDSSKDFDESDDDSDSDYDSDDSEEDEETPKKADVGEKRPAESSKTPANDKKRSLLLLKRLVARKAASTQQLHTLQSRLGKNQLRPTSQSSRLLNRSFNSDGALQSHTKAKHSAAK